MPHAMRECPVPSGERSVHMHSMMVGSMLVRGRKHVGTRHPLPALLPAMRWCYEACGWRHADAVGGMRMRLEVVLRGMRMRLGASVRGMRLEVLA